MSITTVGDHLIHYEVVGRGEPLIFIHGWLGSWRYWWSSMQAMSRHHRTFAFDLWGYGDSSKAPDMYSFESYVEMLEGFIDKLGIAHPVTLVGHSLGAAIAVRYANKNPAGVNRIVAVSMPIQGEYIHRRLANTDNKSFMNRVLGKSSQYPEVDSELRKTDTKAMNSVAQELARVNFSDDIEMIDNPLLLVYGNNDSVIQLPTGDDRHFQRSDDKRAYVTLESCNHFPMLEANAKFSRLILDFVHSENNFKNLGPKEYWQRRTH